MRYVGNTHRSDHSEAHSVTPSKVSILLIRLFRCWVFLASAFNDKNNPALTQTLPRRCLRAAGAVSAKHGEAFKPFTGHVSRERSHPEIVRDDRLFINVN